MIEGAVGSEYKIDALYLSPGISVCSRIQQLCEHTYDASIMMSEEFKYCLPQTSLMLRFNRNVTEFNEETQEEVLKQVKVNVQTLRMVDKVFIKSRGIPMELFSFDIRLPEENIIVPEEHTLGDIVIDEEQERIADKDLLEKYPLNYMFSNDEDIFHLQSHRVTNDFYAEYNEAIEAYLDGEWEYAIEAMDKCLTLDPDDGPCKEMKRFLQDENNSQAPEKWMGYRNVDYKITLEDVSGPPYDGSEESAQFNDGDEEASESDM